MTHRVSPLEARQYAEAHNMEFVEVSAVTGDGIEQMLGMVCVAVVGPEVVEQWSQTEMMKRTHRRAWWRRQ